ncbi:MAG: FAD-dependent thymidylate synthase [Synergistaceae bacterium]
MPIEVELIASTPDAARIVAAAAKICYSPSGAVDILDGLDREKTVSFLKMLRESGHLSPFEHISFTFAVEGISRVATHQLVRHRLASYSQQSQRYVAMSGQTCIVPPSVLNNEKAHVLFMKQVEDAWNCYKELVDIGISKEDARFILPHGTETRLVMTMNARELHHFFSLRLCRRAQWEIRELARKMLILARDAAPEIFDPAGPSCVVEGVCKEAHSCNEPYENMEKMLSE